jgi:26S proteasome regulatory subunit N10
MLLETTIMIIENSEYMGNGYYTPSQIEAQSDTVTVVLGLKIDLNPENTVEVMTSGGKG